MSFPRRSGVLLHPTSLPGPYGVGEMGPEAVRFADTLQRMGQALWQILPLGPTGYGDSPYQSLSTFAGNPVWIGFDWLIEDGLLTRKDLAAFPAFPDHHVDFGPVLQAREALLDKVGRSFARRASGELKDAFEAFCEQQRDWLDDFALFLALKRAHDLRPWVEWAPELVRREPSALNAARRRLASALKQAKVEQFLFDRQWHRMRAVARERGLSFIGDIPIFVAHDSADVWARPELFFLDEQGRPTTVAGVPPDYFSATGQLWGNPLYRWDRHEADDYAWWTSRMRRILDLVDIVRIDHFRGFAAYWEIPAGETTAINGRWVNGPGAAFFDALKRQLGHEPAIIAEDLGVITPDVEALRDRFGFPGMRILQFAFGDDDKAADYRPESYPPNCVVYTGTHDNDTTVGWFHSKPGEGSTRDAESIAEERKHILAYLGTDGSNIHWDLIELALKSNANTAIAPLQDLMGLDSSARMNTPGVPGGNWRWRFTWDRLDETIVNRMAHWTRATGRMPG